ncbi:MAG TPA: holo-ACP synthase [Acidimicrobiales bacterium]|jgi:holo-[acyl-carrier protein] synthase|nr:holo-ACP synthase [Acidimicrobiales bacterium]
MRVGIDLTEIDQVADSMSRFGERYVRRTYSERELADCGGETEATAEQLGVRFAAKEATLKALGVPRGFGVDWRQIEVRGSDRRPTLHLGPSVAALATAAGIDDWLVSLTCEGHLAAAIVIGT